MYDLIVLGATFAAAGIAHRYKEKCLIIERRAQAGYEFFSSLNFGINYDKEVKEKESQDLQQKFLEAGENLYDCNRYIYPYLSEADVIFGAEVVSVEQTEDGFVCVAHGIDGFCTYKAKRVVDSRCSGEMCISKSYNLLIESPQAPSFSNMHCRKAEGQNRYIIHCPVPLLGGYVQARSIAQNVIEGFSETQRLIFSADEFDYQVKDGYPKTENGILYLPSKAYENPILAFDAGLGITEGA